MQPFAGFEFADLQLDGEHLAEIRCLEEKLSWERGETISLVAYRKTGGSTDEKA